MAAHDLMVLHGDDTVGVAVRAIRSGDVTGAGGITARANIQRGHKMALTDIAAGAVITKYGQFIGTASQAIAAGEHVHTHNCAFSPAELDYEFGTAGSRIAPVAADARRTFMGYQRAGGQAGTRNYIAVISSVNCSASVCQYIVDAFNRTGALDGYDNIDGVVAITHGTGCGLAGSGDGFDNFERVVWGMASHGNFGGVLLVGLGCEVFQISAMMKKYALVPSDRLAHMTIQAAGGTRKTIDLGVARITEMLGLVNDVARRPTGADKLVLALQCGGSDAWSGVTANPALGVASDLLVAQGGTSILAETPEIYGAEHLLTRRAVSREVGDELIGRIRWWEDYTARNGGSLDNNPSPGNKAGGLTTILEKSLGAVAKGGQAPLAGVYRYGEKVDRSGFVFMDSPGYDPASITGQVAGGANVVCFTTGRGSVYGCKPSPCLKLATNTPMYQVMADDMDINCGDILDDQVSIEQKGRDIFEAILKVASGEKTRSEELGLGDHEFVPWQVGAMM